MTMAAGPPARDEDPRIGSGPMTLTPGAHLWWHFQRSTWRPGSHHAVNPVTVVRDDPSGLVVWMAPGTTVLRSVLDTGDDVRTAPLAERFRRGRSTARSAWQGEGILCIAPATAPWSVWLFWAPGWQFSGWYINLETPYRREGDHFYTEDHVLDVWVTPDRTCRRKDEDELEAAVEQGWFTAETAAAITRNAEAAEAAVASWQSPFCEGWETWRPDPAWLTPPLPQGSTWDFDLTAPTAPPPRA